MVTMDSTTGCNLQSRNRKITPNSATIATAFPIHPPRLWRRGLLLLHRLTAHPSFCFFSIIRKRKKAVQTFSDFRETKRHRGKTSLCARKILKTYSASAAGASSCAGTAASSSAAAGSSNARMERLTRFFSKSMSVIFALTTSPIFSTSCGFSIL